ncbi:TolC family protein [Algoriphagus namhaensis]
MKKPIYLALMLFTCAFPVFSQEKEQENLNLEKAIQLGLENNFDVKIAVENISLTDFDRKIGVGDFFMPTLDATYSRSFGNEDVEQKFLNDPEPRTIEGAKSNTENFTLAAIYGFRPESFVAIKRLGQLNEISELDAKVVIENTVANISSSYYRLVLELQRYQVLERTLELSQSRLDIAQAQYELGGAGRRDFLTAEVDYYSDLTLLKAQEQVIKNARVDLNQLLALEADAAFAVKDTILIGEDLNLLELQENAFLENKQLLIIQRQENVAYLQEKELRAQRLPVLNLNGSYNNNTFNSDAGFLVQNQRQGFNFGGNVTLNLFSGLTLNRRIQAAKVQRKITDYALNQYEVQLEADIQRAFNTYETNKALLEIEKKNYAVAKENTDLALERFRLGISSYLEFRDAQVNLLSAENRLITSIFNIKEQEIELMRLSGKIFFTNSFEPIENILDN